MLNRSGVTKKSFSSVKQILANVEFQESVGCIVPKSLGISEDDKTIAKAGTPIKIDLSDLQEEVELATASVAMNAVLLHDVDVTQGAANGTALIFGFINLNRIDATTQGKITTARGATGVSPLLTFMNV